jgi:hypothetical protein
LIPAKKTKVEEA